MTSRALSSNETEEMKKLKLENTNLINELAKMK